MPSAVSAGRSCPDSGCPAVRRPQPREASPRISKKTVQTEKSMKKHLIRSVKYFVALCVLYLVVMALMFVTNTSLLTPAETFRALVHSTRGQVMIAAMLLLSALYPRFGFISRQVVGHLMSDREQVVNAFAAEGFRPVRESEYEIVFRGDTLPRRLSLLFEDEIRVTQNGEWIVIEGIRRGVARVYFRLENHLNRKER